MGRKKSNQTNKQTGLHKMASRVSVCLSRTVTHYSLAIDHTLNKSENATPELFAIYMQNYANQECKWKFVLMFKYWVMHYSKFLRMLSRGNTWKPFICDRGPIFRVANLNRSLTRLGLQ